MCMYMSARTNSSMHIQYLTNVCSIKIDPDTLYLVEEIENVVIFPMDTGRFHTSQISEGMTYEVHGELVTDRRAPLQLLPNQILLLDLTLLLCYQGTPILLRYLNKQMYRATKKTFRKAVSLVSTDPMRASTSKASRLEHRDWSTPLLHKYICASQLSSVM